MPIDVSPDLVQTLYIGCYGRPADPEGMVFWTRQFKTQAKRLPTLELFSTAEEFQQQLKALGTQGFITQALGRLFVSQIGAPLVEPKVSPLVELLRLVDDTAQQDPQQLTLTLKQAHRVTWLLALANVDYNRAVADSFVDNFSSPEFVSSGLTGARQLVGTLPIKAEPENSPQRREFMRQLVSSLPAQIPQIVIKPKKKFNEAIIHIGTEKTGSSSLQAFLVHNRKLLAERGIAYVHTRSRDDNRELAFYGVDSFIEDDYAYQLGLLTEQQRAHWKDNYEVEFAKRLYSLPDATDTVVFSSEHLQSRLKSPGNVAMLRFLLAPFFNKVTVFVYLRRQDQLAVSLYSTKCRNGWIESGMFPVNTGPGTPYYNYEKLLNRWAAAFGSENVEPRIFETDKLIGGDLVSDFVKCTKLDVNLQQAHFLEKKNESIPEAAQVAVERLNRAYPVFRQQPTHPEIRKARLKIIRRVTQLYPGRPRMPLREQAVEFAAMFNKSNQAVSQHWFRGEALFSTDFSQYPESKVKPDYDVREIDRLITSIVGKLPAI